MYPQCDTARRFRGTALLSDSRFYQIYRKWRRQHDFRRNGTGVLYPEPRHRCDGDFGSYIGKDHTLTGETINICLLDTLVAFLAGLIIFPSCFAFGVDPGQGPGLVFITLPNIFNQMVGGRIFGVLFFVFMTFAAQSTIIAVFENIISFSMDLFGTSRKKPS